MCVNPVACVNPVHVSCRQEAPQLERECRTSEYGGMHAMLSITHYSIVHEPIYSCSFTPFSFHSQTNYIKLGPNNILSITRSLVLRRWTNESSLSISRVSKGILQSISLYILVSFVVLFNEIIPWCSSEKRIMLGGEENGRAGLKWRRNKGEGKWKMMT